MNRLILVSNRLPFALERTGTDEWIVTLSAGGLVSALAPVLRGRGGTWIGWPGVAGDIPNALFAEATRDAGYEVVPVALSEPERDEFYYGYSNEVIWPLFHDLQNFCHFEATFWETYKAVHERGVHAALTFFLHIPFPPFDIFAKLPQQRRLLRALLEFDLLGFQTRRDLRNFLQCVRRVLSDAEVLPSAGIQRIHYGGREIRASRFPIGIDFESFEKGAVSEEVAQRTRKLRAAFPGCQLMLGADRLDYSKGIPERLRAFRDALERHP